ncbi:MAG: VWA domain-containing protein [Proteobacteria bacterium]|nr:VWA domain-containing protein [Pseudomonadota bacterium]
MQSGISEFWRKNVSTSEALELANVLRALRKVAGHLGSNTGLIEYAGMSQGGKVSILIEPAIIMGRYPIPSEKVDYLVGLVTHEALHRTEWSDHVWKLLEPEFEKMGGLARVGFQKMVFTGEDIYIDQVADQKVFGLYVAKARKNAVAEAETMLRHGTVSLDALMHVWWATNWTNESNLEIDSAYRKALSRLGDLSRELKKVGLSNKSVTARCGQRKELYLDTWRILEEAVSSWKIVDKTLIWYPSTVVSSKGKTEENGIQDKKPSLPDHLVREIETQLAINSVDITPLIRSIVDSEQETIVSTSRWDYNIKAHPMIDQRLVSRLKAIFVNFAGRNQVVSRGLLSGRIDKRRLYRAPVSGRCFRQIDHIPDMDWSVTLLLDASASMKGNKWKMVENTVANLLKALMGYRNRLQAYAYFESDGICMVSQLVKDNQLFSVPPNGLTASGQAIIAAAYLMSKRRKQNILIHVTDGESNFGCDVQHGIEYCRKQKIHLVTLGCGNKNREAMAEQYGKTIQFLDHFGQLPQAIESLLKWTFLYGTKPHLQANQYLKNAVENLKVLKPN